MVRILNILSSRSDLLLVVGAALLLQVSWAQNNLAKQDATQKQDATKEPAGIVSQPTSNSSGQKNLDRADSTAFVLGPGDEVEITVYGAPDLSEHTRVSADGNISMPLIGYVRLAGLTSSEAEGAIENQLRQGNILNDPQVSLYVKEYTSSGVSVAGEVTKPGVYSALGPHRLFDVLQMAGGLTDKASGSVVVSHKGDESNPVTVELSGNPAEMAHNNVEVRPGDTLFAAKAAMVYVLGDVHKPGAYILNSTGAVTVLQIVAAAGGPTNSAAAGGARMLRRTPQGLQEFPVPLKDLLRGKGTDIAVSAEDILFVPSSRMKAFVKVTTVVATAAATTAIYHVY
jgi:polysaccharide export outer membrane protein